jgi:hypothetical protein
MRKFVTKVWISFLFSVVLPIVGCGGADLGEPCDRAGETDECVAGAICTNDSSGNFCRKICRDSDECPAGYSCNGVTRTSTKSCQPDLM